MDPKAPMKITNEMKCAYFGALIVGLVVICYYIMQWQKKRAAAVERLNVGYPYAYGASSFTQGWGKYAQSGMSSGAYMRNLSQEMSQPKQGEYTTPSAMEVKGVEDFVWPEQTVGQITSPGVAALAARARGSNGEPQLSTAGSAGNGRGGVLSLGERLVSGRGEPDFWELPNELRTAQVKQAGVRYEKFVVGGTNTVAHNDVDAYTYPWVY